ncbi:MAG TPA: hypothetical protein VFC78_04050 [Tepidisphaeraceae bacterium]|nr:hypothetical protein [Tepidisphaeraceae bacterium]
MKRRTIQRVTGVSLALVLCGGCSVVMEDGYKPHSLNATPDARRAYYASPFTDQAAAAHRAPGQEGPRGPAGY